MPVVSAKAAEAFKDIAKGLNVKPKNFKDADGNGGDGQGNYIQARVSAGTKRKQGDSDDSDADPLDAVWGGPILSSRSSGSKAAADDDTFRLWAQKPTRAWAANRGGGGTDAGSARHKDKADKIAGSERKKQMDAEQAAKSALLDGEGLLNKLEDAETVLNVSYQQLLVCKKKIAYVLSLEKVRLLTHSVDP